MLSPRILGIGFGSLFVYQQLPASLIT